MGSKHVLAIAAFVVVGWLVGDVRAGAISVGSSTLIKVLDYSDTFTTSANGGNSARVDNQYPVADKATAALVENCYGNPQRSWPYPSPYDAGLLNFGNFASDATAYPTGWPGGSGAGSATGMAQSGVNAGDIRLAGIAYNLRDRYVVQVDGANSTVYSSITTGGTASSQSNANGLTVFFRKSTLSPQIGLYNVGIGEKNTGLTSGITTTGWYNRAVEFDLGAGLLSIYVDQVLRGTVDLKTFDGGSFWAKVNASTNDYVTVGFTNSGTWKVYWTDNFQVGNPIPEPSTLALLAAGLAGLLCYAWRKRK